LDRTIFPGFPAKRFGQIQIRLQAAITAALLKNSLLLTLYIYAMKSDNGNYFFRQAGQRGFACESAESMMLVFLHGA
jgi:hypothetical protein